MFVVQDQVYNYKWANILFLIGIMLSMTVNALVTGLIVFRIFKVFQEVKACTANDQCLGVTGGSTLRRVIFILIESGMALFAIQLARLLVSIAVKILATDASYNVYALIIPIHEMLNVIMTINHCYVILLIT